MVVSKLFLLFVSALMALSASSAADAGAPDSSAANVMGPQPTVRRAISDAEMMATLKRAALDIQRSMKDGKSHHYPPLNLSSASVFESKKVPGTSSLYLLQKDGKPCLTSTWNLDTTIKNYFGQASACFSVEGDDIDILCYYWVEVHNACLATTRYVLLNCWDPANGLFNALQPVKDLYRPIGGHKHADGYSCLLNRVMAPGETYRFDYASFGKANSWNDNHAPWNMWVMDARWLHS